jgi:hypothetical protein
VIRLIVLLTALCALPAEADPILSIDITAAQNEDYDVALQIAKSAGAKATSLSIFWDEMETVPGAFSPKQNWPAIANFYFSFTGLKFTLNFSVIDTVADRRPSDLKDLPWDDPLVIARFASHVDAVLGRMKNVPFIAITVGNEVDAHLQSPEDIAAFATFLRAARTEIAHHRPDAAFGSKLTFAGLHSDLPKWHAIIETGDGLFATYYPLDGTFAMRPLTEVPSDIDILINAAAGKPLWLLETGYASAGCGGSEQAQSDFFALMRAEAQKRPQIALISFTFLTDFAPAVVDEYVDYYGVSEDCFARYLGSIGLRNSDGSSKQALRAMMD